MSIFGDIIRKIFPAGHPAVTGQPSQEPATRTAGAPAAKATGTPSAGAAGPAGAAASAVGAPAAAASAAPVDVEAILTGLAQKSGQPSNWRTSIVDLMKLLQLDSSLTARKELAKELGYGGDMNDSASMNIWLHKQVMTKLAQNGGKVPAELRG